MAVIDILASRDLQGNHQLNLRIRMALYSYLHSNMQLLLTYNLHNITHLKIQFFPLHDIYTYQ